jgi:hypothetical protein
MFVSVSTDISGALEKFRTVREDVRDKAVVRALNKTGQQVKTQAAREIRGAGYNVKIGEIKKSINLIRANATTLTAIVKARGKPIGLIQYGARAISSGVSVQVKNGRKVIKHAFIATMPSGHKGVFLRVGVGHRKVIKGGKVTWHGLPIQELFGPSIPSAFINKTVQQALAAAVREKFPRLLKHEIEYLRLKS